MKTGLAAALALVAYRSLHLPHGYWAVISAIIVMQSNLGSLLQASTYRLLGTAIGAVVGAIMFWAAETNVVSIFFAIAVTLLICTWLKLQDAMRLAGVTVAIVMLIGQEMPLHAGVNRFIDVALGIVSAVVVSLAWPSRARHELRRSLAATYEQLRGLFTLVVAGCLGGDCDHAAIDGAKAESVKRAARNTELLSDVQREPGSHTPLLQSLKESADRLRDHIYGIDYSARRMEQDSVPRQLEPQLGALFAAIEQAFNLIAADLRDQPVPTPTASLDNALEEVENRFTDLRQTGHMRQYDNDELLRFYSLFYRLRQLTNELIRDTEFANALEHAG